MITIRTSRHVRDEELKTEIDSGGPFPITINRREHEIQMGMFIYALPEPCGCNGLAQPIIFAKEKTKSNPKSVFGVNGRWARVNVSTFLFLL